MATSPTIINRRPPPGMWLKVEILEPHGTTQYRLAKDLGVAQSLISRIINGEARMTATLVIRLAAYFGNSAEFWLNLQQNHDLTEARSNVDVSAIPAFDAAS